jgi:pimeloyl-ACP methyl ester carboxylesterase
MYWCRVWYRCRNIFSNVNLTSLPWICRNWELNAPWTGAKVKVPVKFIVGDLDLTYNAPGAKDYIHKGGLKRDVPLLEDVVVIEGAGHFVHQERADEINKHIYDFFKKF